MAVKVFFSSSYFEFQFIMLDSKRKARNAEKDGEREKERFFKSFLNELVFFIFYLRNVLGVAKFGTLLILNMEP